MNGGGKRRAKKTPKRRTNKSLKAWVAFVKKVQREEKLSYKEAIHRAKVRKDKGEKWMKGGNGDEPFGSPVGSENGDKPFGSENGDKPFGSSFGSVNELKNGSENKSPLNELSFGSNESQMGGDDDDDEEEDYDKEDDDNKEEDYVGGRRRRTRRRGRSMRRARSMRRRRGSRRR